MQVAFDRADLKPLVEAVIAELVDRLAPMDDRMAVDEQEASRLFSVKPHVLRDARLRGELKGRKLGKKIVYSRKELARFIEGSES
jgi:hypothetical protein